MMNDSVFFMNDEEKNLKKPSLGPKGLMGPPCHGVKGKCELVKQGFKTGKCLVKEKNPQYANTPFQQYNVMFERN
jgi:hypothetical protein